MRNPRSLLPDEIRFFRDQLRDARAAALADAEGFQKILFAIEAFGERLYAGTEPGSLDRYRPVFCEWARMNCEEFDMRFEVLFDVVKDARNDAMHQGAIARHITNNAIQLAIVLEDALMCNARTVGDFMVRDVVCAHAWHTLGHVRRLMLASSFSSLPWWRESDRKWFLVRDHDVATFLCDTSKKERRKRMRMTLEEAVGYGNVPLVPPVAFDCAENVGIPEALLKLKDQTLVVVVCDQAGAGPMGNENTSKIAGIITAYDLL